MGAYVNPTDMSKEKWLLRNAKEVNYSMKWETVPENFLPVVLVDNGMFTAAGIAYNKGELEAFTDPTDIRPKRYFLAPIHRLHEVSSELEGYMERG